MANALGRLTLELLLIIISSTAFVAYATDSANLIDVCTSAPDEVCSPVELDIDLRQDPIFPDAKFLDQNCGSLLTELKCLILYNNTCGYAQKRGIPVSIESLFFHIARTICQKDTIIAKAYRQNVDCVNGLGEDMRSVIQSSSREIREYLKLVEKVKLDFRMANDYDKVSCIYLTVLLKKLSDLVEEGCGVEASNVLQYVYEPLFEDCPDESEMMPYQQLLIRFVLEKAMA